MIPVILKMRGRDIVVEPSIMVEPPDREKELTKRKRKLKLGDIFTEDQLRCIIRIARNNDLANNVQPIREYFLTIKADLTLKKVDPGYMAYQVAWLQMQGELDAPAITKKR